MNKWVMRIGIGLLLLVHGLAHWQLSTGWGAQSEATSWLLSGRWDNPELVARLGTALWAAAFAHFLVAAVMEWFAVSVWRLFAFMAALFSLAAIVLFWQPAMIVGALVSLAIVVALAGFQWPRWTWLGA